MRTSAAFLGTLALSLFLVSCDTMSPLTEQAMTSPGEVPSFVSADSMYVHFIDVGQGAAVFLRTTEGGYVLVDAGNSNGIARDYVAQYVDTLDVLVVTHAHVDHMAGATQVLNQIPVREVWYNGQEHTTQAFQNFQDALDDAEQIHGTTVSAPLVGYSATIGGMNLQVLHPDQDASSSSANFHRHNMVVRAWLGDFAVVVTGDAETQEEATIIDSELTVGATILQLGHHGSTTSSGQDWFDAVQPTYSIYQASSTNQYGHPHEDVIGRAHAVSTVYGSDVHGHIVFGTDGSDYSLSLQYDNPPVTGDPPAETCGVDLNESTHAELQDIIHIGPSRADQIINLRPIYSVDDLINVSGIGPSSLQDIKDQGLACVRDCVELNTASHTDLQQIIHIGPSRATQVIDLRPHPDVDNLINVSGIGPSSLQDIKDQNLACVF